MVDDMNNHSLVIIQKIISTITNCVLLFSKVNEGFSELMKCGKIICT